MLFSLSTALMRGHLVQHQRGIIVLKAFIIFAQFEGTHILARPNCAIFAICGGKFFMTHTCGGMTHTFSFARTFSGSWRG